MRATFGLLSLVVGLAGCCHCGSGTGWSFQMGRPATVPTQTLVHPTQTMYATSGIASGPVMGAYAPIAPLPAPPLQLSAPAPCGPVSALPAGPSLKDIRDQIDELQKGMRRLSPPDMLPAPRKCVVGVEGRLDTADQGDD